MLSCDRWTRRTRTGSGVSESKFERWKKLFENGRKLDNEDEVRRGAWEGKGGRLAWMNVSFRRLTWPEMGNGARGQRDQWNANEWLPPLATPSVPCRARCAWNRGDLVANVHLAARSMCYWEKCNYHAASARSLGQVKPWNRITGGYYATRRVAQVRMPSNNMRKLINAVN